MGWGMSPGRGMSPATEGGSAVRRARWAGVAVLGGVLATASLSAQSVTRGPYLQLGSPTSITVRWRTDVNTNSRVRYGSAPGSLTTTVNDATVEADHEVTLSGLSDDTLYFYSVGTSAQVLAGDDADHFFVTSPTAGTTKPTRIWVLGDSGTGDANAESVRDAYLAFAGSTHTDLWLMLGDNAYEDGLDSEYQTALFDMYPMVLRESVLWPTLGNHDGRVSSTPYYDIFTLPTAAEAGGSVSGTEAYYSFEYANIHFICLDSFETDRSAPPGGAMLSWLETDLAAVTQDWIIAFWHHPPYSKGSHDSDNPMMLNIELEEMRENALPLLEAAGVDLVLTGHSHSYERSFLLDGHYDTSGTFDMSMKVDGGDGRPAGDGSYEKPSAGQAPNEGAVYVVAGNAGQLSGGSLNHPAMFISLNTLGSLVLDVNANRLDCRLLDTTGTALDNFTIVKDPGPPPSAPAGLEALGTRASIFLDWDDNPEPLVAGYSVHARSAVTIC